MGVYVDVSSGEVRRVIDDLEYPNGVRVSADGSALYVADTRRGELWRFAILAPGRLGERKLLFSGDPVLDGPGPDGIALDSGQRLRHLPVAGRRRARWSGARAFRSTTADQLHVRWQRLEDAT
jgi:sugar lactone lactonase YvrE